jgi:hypothetical protein
VEVGNELLWQTNKLFVFRSYSTGRNGRNADVRHILGTHASAKFAKAQAALQLPDEGGTPGLDL